MKKQEIKNVVDMIYELKKDHVETVKIVRDNIKGVSRNIDLKQLLRAHNKPRLIKIGLALIAFPDPTISDVVGSALIALGLIQTKIKSSALYVEDVYKTFPKVMKNLDEMKQNVVDLI